MPIKSNPTVEGQRSEGSPILSQSRLDECRAEVDRLTNCPLREMDHAVRDALKAARSQNGLTKEALAEIRVLRSPPHTVKAVLKAACVLLNANTGQRVEWGDVERALQDEHDFHTAREGWGGTV